MQRSSSDATFFVPIVILLLMTVKTNEIANYLPNRTRFIMLIVKEIIAWALWTPWTHCQKFMHLVSRYCILYSILQSVPTFQPCCLLHIVQPSTRKEFRHILYKTVSQGITHTTFGETHVQHIQYTYASIYKKGKHFLRSGSLEENLDMINVDCQSDRMSW